MTSSPIPMKEGVTKIINYQPISLLKYSFKLITKVLTNLNY